jgi:hypothetical protein
MSNQRLKSLTKCNIEESFFRLNSGFTNFSPKLNGPSLENKAHSNGFNLRGSGCSLRFIRNTFGSRNILDFLVKDRTPYIQFSSEYTDPLDPDTISCDSISFLRDENIFSFPLGEESLDNIGNCLSFHKSDDKVLNLYEINPEYFHLGTEILRTASEVFNLPSYYRAWCREFEPNILQKLARYVIS